MKGHATERKLSPDYFPLMSEITCTLHFSKRLSSPRWHPAYLDTRLPFVAFFISLQLEEIKWKGHFGFRLWRHLN